MDAFAHYPRTPAEGLRRTPPAPRPAPLPARIGHADTLAARRDQCPRCRALATAPRVSSYQPGGVIAHHWQCECCNSGWDTFFQPLLV